MRLTAFIIAFLWCGQCHSQIFKNWNARLQADFMATVPSGMFVKGTEALAGKRGIDPGFSLGGMLVYKNRGSIGLYMEDHMLALASRGSAAGNFYNGFYTTVSGGASKTEVAFFCAYGSLIRKYKSITVEPYIILGSGGISNNYTYGNETRAHSKQIGSNFYFDEVSRPTGGSVRYSAGAGVSAAKRISPLFSVYVAAQFSTAIATFTTHYTYTDIDGKYSSRDEGFGQSLSLYSLKVGVQVHIQKPPVR